MDPLDSIAGPTSNRILVLFYLSQSLKSDLVVCLSFDREFSYTVAFTGFDFTLAAIGSSPISYTLLFGCAFVCCLFSCCKNSFFRCLAAESMEDNNRDNNCR